MKDIAYQIKEEIHHFYYKYNSIDNDISSVILDEDKWSLKQIIGHLIDSASNNHQRIVRLQLCSVIDFPDYQKDQWLEISNYHTQDFSELISLLKYYNILIAHLISRIPPDSLSHRWNFKWSEEKDYITLGELVKHYLWHLKEHIKHFENRLAEIEQETKH